MPTYLWPSQVMLCTFNMIPSKFGEWQLPVMLFNSKMRTAFYQGQSIKRFLRKTCKIRWLWKYGDGANLSISRAASSPCLVPFTRADCLGLLQIWSQNVP